MWDIYFESRTKGKGGQTHDERVTVVVRWDSDGDGLAEASDELVAGATVRLILTGPGLNADFSGDTSNGKKNQGVFSTGWLPDLAVGVYAAEVTGLAHADYTWDRALEPTSNVADADGDTLPDRQHNSPISRYFSRKARRPLNERPPFAFPKLGMCGRQIPTGYGLSTVTLNTVLVVVGPPVWVATAVSS